MKIDTNTYISTALFDQTTPPLKGPCHKDFTVCCMGLVGYPFHLLCSILLPLISWSLALFLFLLKSFLLLFFPFVILPSSISNFSLVVPKIPDQISCCSTHITFLLCIYLAILLYRILDLLFLFALIPHHILLWTFLPSLLHFTNFPLALRFFLQ